VLYCGRVERLTAENTASSSQNVEAIHQLMSQNETLTLTFKVCIILSFYRYQLFVNITLITTVNNIGN